MNTLNKKFMVVMLTALTATQVVTAGWMDSISSFASSAYSRIPNMSMPSISIPESVTSRLTARNGGIVAGVIGLAVVTYALSTRSAAQQAEAQAEVAKTEAQAKVDAEVLTILTAAPKGAAAVTPTGATPEAIAQADAILAEANKLPFGQAVTLEFAQRSEAHKQAALKANKLNFRQKKELGL